MTAFDLADDALFASIGAVDPVPPSVLADARAAFTAGLIPALTVKQHRAGLIAAGLETTENRTWEAPRKYRGGYVWIHSSAGKPDAAPLRPDGTDYKVPQHLQARGRILALATLADCHKAIGCCGPWGEPDGFHWTLTDVRALPEPIPAKGRLGLWKPPVGLAAEALGQLEAAHVHGVLRNVCSLWTAGTDYDDLLIQHPLFPVPETVGATR